MSPGGGRPASMSLFSSCYVRDVIPLALKCVHVSLRSLLQNSLIVIFVLFAPEL